EEHEAADQRDDERRAEGDGHVVGQGVFGVAAGHGLEYTCCARRFDRVPTWKTVFARQPRSGWIAEPGVAQRTPGNPRPGDAVQPRSGCIDPALPPNQPLRGCQTTCLSSLYRGRAARPPALRSNPLAVG